MKRERLVEILSYHDGLKIEVVADLILDEIEKSKAPDKAAERDDGVREALKRAVSALKPFAARVYNDNGDITVSDTYRCGLEEFTAAYFAHRACVDALASLPALAGDVVPGEAQTQEGGR